LRFEFECGLFLLADYRAFLLFRHGQVWLRFYIPLHAH
jgi:hypothetical protein